MTWQTAPSLVETLGISERAARALALLSDLWPLDDGPAHIVIADFNLDKIHFESCIAGIDAGDTCSADDIPAGDPVYAATRALLVYLRDLPDDETTIKTGY